VPTQRRLAGGNGRGVGGHDWAPQRLLRAAHRADSGQPTAPLTVAGDGLSTDPMRVSTVEWEAKNRRSRGCGGLGNILRLAGDFAFEVCWVGFRTNSGVFLQINNHDPGA
jgi:hypothetical protein